MGGSAREHALARVRRALDGRRLLWFGIRGEDAGPLLALPEFSASFAVTAALRVASLRASDDVTLEGFSGHRPDLDRYDLDEDGTPEADEFRRRLAECVRTRAVLMTYRPSAFTSALSFAHSDTLVIAGMFHDQQRAFEHKPWVESALRRRGVRTLEWRYVADAQRGRAKRLLDDGPVVLRVSRASGGVGMVVAHDAAEIDSGWPAQPDAFVAVAPYREGALPLNFSGCVFPDGSVRLHAPSVQLIGVPDCTMLPLGYCGNDFGAVAAIDSALLGDLDTLGRDIGRWLHEQRYVGVFGVDALIHQGQVYFTEVNPRFQGSSAMSAGAAESLDVSDLYLDHLLAHLAGDPMDAGLSLAEWAHGQSAMAHAVVHNTSAHHVVRVSGAPGPLPEGVGRVQSPGGLSVAPGGVLARLVCSRPMTTTGFDLAPEVLAAVRRVQLEYHDEVADVG